MVLPCAFMSKSLTFLSWNVRGLGQSCRCEDVLSELLSSRPSFVAIQETKLPSLSSTKKRSFLPSRLSTCATRDSLGAAGGMLTAWDASVCMAVSVSPLPHTLTVSFSLLADVSTFMLTNVYAPARHEDKPAFFTELAAVAATVAGPWMLIGDFNLTRCLEDKNNCNFNSAEANHFNDLINSLGLIEIPLIDRAYTWSNRRAEPTLVRLDRCFVNVHWDAVFPNTTMSSLTRLASDHVPLLATVCTRIPPLISWRNNARFMLPKPRSVFLPSRACKNYAPKNLCSGGNGFTCELR